MTITDQTQPLTSPLVADVYRDIHKGIRSYLFSVVSEAGSIDPSDRTSRSALAQRVSSLASLLESHAEHEDGFFQPVIEVHQPRLAEIVATDHARFEVRFRDITEMALLLGDGPRDARFVTQQLYLELASFTGAYLQHQDLEERVVMPAIEAAIGADARARDRRRPSWRASRPTRWPTSLAVMLPAMNVDDRSELLGGIQAGAPAEVFAGVWGLAGSVLTPADLTAVATRLGIPA